MPRRGLYSQSKGRPALCRTCTQSPLCCRFSPPPTMLRLKRCYPFLFMSAALMFCIACTPKEKEKAHPERTEPWRRDETAGTSSKTPSLSKFIVAGKPTLELSLPTKRLKPIGALHRVRGTVSLNPHQLQFVSGTIEFDLRQLLMDDTIPLPPLQTTKLHDVAGLQQKLTQSSWTKQA